MWILYVTDPDAGTIRGRSSMRVHLKGTANSKRMKAGANLPAFHIWSSFSVSALAAGCQHHHMSVGDVAAVGKISISSARCCCCLR